MQSKDETTTLSGDKIVKYGCLLCVGFYQCLYNLLLFRGNVQVVECFQIPLYILHIVDVEDHCLQSDLVTWHVCMNVHHFLSERLNPCTMAGIMRNSSSLMSILRKSPFFDKPLRTRGLRSRSRTMDGIMCPAFECRAYFSESITQYTRDRYTGKLYIPSSSMIFELIYQASSNHEYM